MSEAPFLMKLQAVICSFIKKEALTQVLYLTLWNRYIPLNFTEEYTDWYQDILLFSWYKGKYWPHKMSYFSTFYESSSNMVTEN